MVKFYFSVLFGKRNNLLFSCFYSNEYVFQSQYILSLMKYAVVLVETEIEQFHILPHKTRLYLI